MARGQRGAGAGRWRTAAWLGSMLIGAAHAQNWQITPSISLVETLTDNVALEPDNTKRSDLITQIVPGIRIDGASARARLNLDYRMSNLLYARDSRRNHLQHYLNGRGTLEAIDNWLFVDAHATITQHSISAFGAQPLTPELDTGNRARTSNYVLSPYIRGRLGLVADYEARYRWSTTSSRADLFGNTETRELSGNLVSAQDRRVGWTAYASNFNIRYDTGRNVEATRLRGTLGYRWDVDWRIHGIIGHESNNYVSPDKVSRVTYGAGFEWTPTERTQVAAVWERRFFGDGHSVSLQHRTARSAWRFTDRKEESILPNQLAFAGAGTAFDLLFDALAASIPNPVDRAREVERLLLQSGIPRDLALRFGFLTNRSYVERVRDASVALLGVNNTVTFSAHVSERLAIGAGSGRVDDFVLSPDIEQRGVSASWSRRISELSSLNVLASHIRSSGAAGTVADSKHSMVRVLLSHRLGPRTHGTVGARIVRYDRATTPTATEHALTASLTMTF
jgi:uncharacterized protein (PEP-CTERM system associated)